jgi:hypothetical protein
MIVESPIVAIVGNKGSGKTLFLTFIAEHAHYMENRKVFSNFDLTEIPYERFDYQMLAELPEHIENAVILMDETQMGADAYEFLSKQSKGITKLATQLRKRKLDLYMTTQRFSFISKRLRDLTDFIFAMEVLRDQNQQIIRGMARVEIYDRNDPFREIPMKDFTFDGRPFFNHYNTNEIID